MIRLGRLFFSFVFIVFFALFFGSIANAQLLSHTLETESKAYTVGIRIAETVGLDMLSGMLEADEHLLYDMYADDSTYDVDGVTWPIINITIKIASQKHNTKEIAFTLAVEGQRAEDGERYYIVGTVQDVLVNGKLSLAMAKYEGTTYCEIIVNDAIEETADSMAFEDELCYELIDEASYELIAVRLTNGNITIVSSQVVPKKL